MMMLGLAISGISGQAAGIQRNGVGAHAMSLGGASVAQTGDPLGAMSSNPAGLGFTNRSVLQLGVWAAAASGEFSKGSGGGELDSALGASPEAAFSYRLQSVPITFGLGMFADSAASLDWKFIDPPGGADGVTSYGLQRHRAEIIALRTALGAGWQVNESLSLGVGLGAVYNRNQLEAPYVFQSHPALRGAKTLLDLETDGWGVNGTVGVVFRPHSTLSLGLSYRTPTHLDTDGEASGNAGVQFENLGAPFDTARPDFRYDANVVTALPQMVSGGAAWQFHPRARAIVQVDWINWSDSFDQLEITLTDGNNADLNGLLGSDRIEDNAPLNWHDQFVYRAGLEFAVCERLLLRAGYAYGANPIPDSAFTPMSAAILEHTLTAGVEWRGGRYSVAAAYQYDLPSEASIGTSGLRSGEFSGSRTKLDAHWFGLTASVAFK